MFFVFFSLSFELLRENEDMMRLDWNWPIGFVRVTECEEFKKDHKKEEGLESCMHACKGGGMFSFILALETAAIVNYGEHLHLLVNHVFNVLLSVCILHAKSCLSIISFMLSILVYIYIFIYVWDKYEQVTYKG